MAELVAQGARPEQRWQRDLVEGQLAVLGRAAGLWTVPWDSFVSRRHAELTYREGKLRVRQLETAQNPVYFHGQRSLQFELDPGEHFVIGSTCFSLIDNPSGEETGSDQPVEQQTFSARELAKVNYRHAGHRLEVLGRLPDVIEGASSDRELFVGLANILLAGIRPSTLVAIVMLDQQAEKPTVRILHWERRRQMEGTFRPSERLVVDALQRRRQSVAYWWRGESDAALMHSVRREGFDWAFCVPVRSEICKGWGLYVAGSADSTNGSPLDGIAIEDDVKFTELVANILGSLRNVRYLQQRQASLTQFFSPAVLGKFAEADPEVALEARRSDVSVLFCDLRGFSRESESHSGDLLRLLERVSKALGVMTSHILDNGGVIGDFQGDAAMGFWGWPVEQVDIVRRACLAAQGIRQHFEAASRREGHSLASFRVGIGIATGSAVAGKIGTTDQAKIGVFGPIVNLASRLESMSKLLYAPILLDERTAREARKTIVPELGRVRRIAVVRPYGLDTPVEVNELLPPASELPELSDEALAQYETALETFIQGDWDKAFTLLHQVPPIDRVKDFLTVYIAQHNRNAPSGWDGVINLTSKR